MKRKEIQDGRRVTIWLSEETIQLAERLATKADMDRGRLLRNLIEVNLRSLERSDKIGIFQMTILLRDLEESLKAWVNGCIDEPDHVGKALG